MTLSDCKIEYDAPAVLQERVASGPVLIRGGPIAEGTFAEMIKRGMALPPEQAVNTSILVGVNVAGGQTWLEFVDYQQIAKRSDFPN